MSNVPHESSQASVSASLTQAVLHAASRLGLDRQALLSVCNLTDQQLADPDARIPFSVQQTLWHVLDSRLQHPEPGLLGADDHAAARRLPPKVERDYGMD